MRLQWVQIIIAAACCAYVQADNTMILKSNAGELCVSTDGLTLIPSARGSPMSQATGEPWWVLTLTSAICWTIRCFSIRLLRWKQKR